MARKKAVRHHNLKLDHRGEFDEVFVKKASVQIERMDEKAFWIGIDAPGMPTLMINTGVYMGRWYFRVEEDAFEGKSFEIFRPAVTSRKKCSKRVTQNRGIRRLKT